MPIPSHQRAALGMKPMLTHGKNKQVESEKKSLSRNFKGHLKESRSSKMYPLGMGGTKGKRLAPKEVYAQKHNENARRSEALKSKMK